MEQSSMEMSSVESSKVSDIAEKEDDNQTGGLLVPLAIGLAALLAMAAAGAAAFQFSIDTRRESTPEDEEVGYISNKGSPPSNKRNTPDSSTTETTARKVRKPSKRPDPESLLCTFSVSTNESTKFPPDGMCDYIFFDSAYANGKNTLATGSDTFEPNLMHFLSEVPKFTKTEFGVAFAYHSRETVADHLKKSDPPRLEVFWNQNVYHFGIIDVPVFGSLDKAGFLRCLKVMAELARTHSDYGTASYIVVGAAIHSKELMAAFHEILSEYQPDLLISLAHYQYGDHERKNCYSMPPTALHRPFHAHGYPYDICSAVQAIANLTKADSEKTNWLISVGMKGRRSLKLPYTATQGIMAPCKQNTSVRYFGVYTEICNDPTFVQHLKYDSNNEAMWTFDQKTTMFVYDNERSLCRKLCTVKANTSSVRFGIAVFDLDYEDSSDQCSKQNQFRGGFSRLQMLRKIVDYFKGFTSEQQKDGCFHLASPERK